MLDKVAMITFLILYVICLFITVFMYLVIIGANKNKTDEEKFYEDQEQIEYLKKYKNGGKSNE
jgi:heme/copper-type cytochrome/quinol oxidase subunit 2